MIRFLEILQRQSRALYLVLAMVAVFGVVAFKMLPSDVYPELAFPRIAVIAGVGDISPERVLVTATRALEEAASQVYRVRWIRSKTIRGATELSVEFQPGTDMVFAWQQLQARLAETRSKLPASTQLIVEPVTPAIFPVLNYNVSSSTISPTDLYNIVRYQVEPRLTQVGGVARVITQAGQIPEISVEVDPEKLKSYRISISDVAAALARSNQVQVLGRVDDRYQQNLIVGPGEAKVPEDLYGIVVSGQKGGEPIFLKDVARISSGFQDSLQLISVDGKPGIVLNIFRQPNSNVVAVSHAIARELNEIENALPPGIVIKRAYDQSTLVTHAIASIFEEILVGIALIIFVLFAFLRSWKSTWIAAMTIPLSAAAAFGFMALTGQSLNLMSLGGLAIAIGLVIDDAIVIVENIHRQLAKGLSADEAAIAAVKEISGPVTSSTATTLVVFLPLGFLSGVAGQFFGALTMTLASAVAFSLLLALTAVPVICAQWLARGRRESVSADTEPAGFNRWYARTLRNTLDRPVIPAIVVAVLLALSAFLFTRLGTDFLPEVDEGSYVLDYFMPSGTSLLQTDEVCRKIERILGESPEVRAWTRRTGTELGLFATEPNTGDILVVLKPHDQRKRNSAQVMDEQREKIVAQMPQVEIEFHPILKDQLNDLSGAGSPVEVRVFGEDAAVIRGIAEEIEERLGKIPGLVDLSIPSQEGAPEFDVDVDPWRAGRLSLTPMDVSDQVRDSMLGKNATQLKQGDKLVDVRVRLNDSFRLDSSKLPQVPIFNRNGAMLPLSALAEIKQVRGEREIHRENQQRYVSVEGEVEGRDLGSVVGEIQSRLKGLSLPQGVSVTIAGIFAAQQETFRQLLFVLLLATVLVYMLMVIQFRSLKQPLAILAVLPVTFLGVEVALLITNTPLNVSSFMGLILLVGLVVKNGIILLEYANRLRATGLSLDDALVEASTVRLRPILMTTLCTLLALLPLALGTGPGAELQRPLAIAVLGGLSLSTVLTLILVPLLARALTTRS